MPSRLHFSAIDESFKPDSVRAVSLHLAFGKDDFRFAVADQQSRKVLALELYQLTGSYNPHQLIKELDQLLSVHPFLNKISWKQVTAHYSLSPACLVPLDLLEEGNDATYFRLQIPLDTSKDQLIRYTHGQFKAVMMHSWPTVLVEWLQKLPSEADAVLVPPLSLLLQAATHIEGTKSESRLYGLALDEKLHLALFRNGQLVFTNTFPFKTPQDLVYFLLLAMQENDLSPDHDQVMLWGEFMPDSPLFNLVRQYVRNVQLGKRPTDLEYPTKLDERFQHLDLPLFAQFYTLYH